MPKEAVWVQVAEVVSAHVNECKAKWGNLRTTFNSNLAKYRSKKSGQGADDSYTVTWKFFKAMLFLEASKVGQSTQSITSMPLVIFVFVSRIIFQMNLNDVSNAFYVFFRMISSKIIPFWKISVLKQKNHQTAQRNVKEQEHLVHHQELRMFHHHPIHCI